jgi:hypothetical protein
MLAMIHITNSSCLHRPRYPSLFHPSGHNHTMLGVLTSKDTKTHLKKVRLYKAQQQIGSKSGSIRSDPAATQHGLNLK